MSTGTEEQVTAVEYFEPIQRIIVNELGNTQEATNLIALISSAMQGILQDAVQEYSPVHKVYGYVSQCESRKALLEKHIKDEINLLVKAGFTFNKVEALLTQHGGTDGRPSIHRVKVIMTL